MYVYHNAVIVDLGRWHDPMLLNKLIPICNWQVGWLWCQLGEKFKSA